MHSSSLQKFHNLIMDFNYLFRLLVLVNYTMIKNSQHKELLISLILKQIPRRGNIDTLLMRIAKWLSRKCLHFRSPAKSTENACLTGSLLGFSTTMFPNLWQCDNITFTYASDLCSSSDLFPTCPFPSSSFI